MTRNDDSGKKIVRLLTKVNSPIDVNFLVEKLKVNKTTVYRQIEKLLSVGVLTEVDFGDGKKRYELKSLGHHHHLICQKCGKLEDINFDENLLMSEVGKHSKFEVKSHNLEFFGICVGCNQKS